MLAVFRITDGQREATGSAPVLFSWRSLVFGLLEEVMEAMIEGIQISSSMFTYHSTDVYQDQDVYWCLLDYDWCLRNIFICLLMFS